MKISAAFSSFFLFFFYSHAGAYEPGSITRPVVCEGRVNCPVDNFSFAVPLIQPPSDPLLHAPEQDRMRLERIPH